MKKKLFCILLVGSLLLSCSGCSKKKKLKEAYYSFGDMSFSDESLLTDEEREKLVDFKLRRLEAMDDNDLEAMEQLKVEWDQFRQPIVEIIDDYKAVTEAYFTKEEISRLSTEENQKFVQMQTTIKKSYESHDRVAFKDVCTSYHEFADNIREMFRLYDSISKTEFSEKDQRLMTREQFNQANNYYSQADQALQNRNLARLQSLSSDWSSFVSSTHSSIEAAKDKLIRNWVSGANLTGSLTSLFSFGKITSDVTVSGHTITIAQQYNFDISEDKAKKDLDSYLNMTGFIIQDGENYLKEYVDDVRIRVEYRNKNGSVLCSREFN